MPASSTPILVIGSRGKTGRRIVERLVTSGHAVKHGSRTSSPPFDWEKPATWPESLRGVESIYVSFYPDLAIASAPATIEALMSCASKAGVKRVVLLSGRGEANALRCEEIVRKSGLGFTLIRASWFSQNFNEGQLLESVLGGVVALPAGEVLEPFVDADDIADVAFAALTDARHDGQLYELTGPRLMSFTQAAAEISKAAGRGVHYAAISPSDFRAALTQSAGPDVANMLTDLCEEVFDGRNASLGDGVQKALGRKARDFTEFCDAAAASGVWTQREC